MNARLLLVAPPSDARIELAELLALQGHPLWLADDLEHAQAQLHHQPALVLVAADAPGFDGLAAGRWLRAHAHAALLALVTEPDRASRVRCLNAGFDDLIAFPADALELRVRVRSLLAAAGAAQLERALLLRDDRQLAHATLSGAQIHDLCNLTVRLQCVLGELEEDLGLPETLREDLREAVGEVATTSKRLAMLTRAQRPAAAEALELSDEVRRTLRQLVALGPLRQIELALRTVPTPTWVWAERAQVEQLVGNLVTTAVEAVADLPAGERAISFEMELRDQEVCLRASAVRPAGSVRNAARPCSSPRPLGLGVVALQALAAVCGGRTALELNALGVPVTVVTLPQAQAPEHELAAAANG